MSEAIPADIPPDFDSALKRLYLGCLRHPEYLGDIALRVVTASEADSTPGHLAADHIIPGNVSRIETAIEHTVFNPLIKDVALLGGEALDRRRYRSKHGSLLDAVSYPGAYSRQRRFGVKILPLNKDHLVNPSSDPPPDFTGVTMLVNQSLPMLRGEDGILQHMVSYFGRQAPEVMYKYTTDILRRVTPVDRAHNEKTVRGRRK